MRQKVKKCNLYYAVIPIILFVSFLLSRVSYAEAEQKRVKPPQTLNEAFEVLDSVLSPQDRESLRDCRKPELINYHFGLGRWIRNNFGLYAGNPKLYEAVGAQPSEHPDEVSAKIIQAYWQYLNRDITIPEFEQLSSGEYFQEVLSHLHRAYLSRSTRMTNFLPAWVFANSRIEIGKSSEKQIHVARKLVRQDSSLACLALLFLAEYEKGHERIALLEEFLRNKEPTILYPLRAEEDPYFSAMLTGGDIAQKFDIEAKFATSKDRNYPKGYLWKVLSIGDISLRSLNKIYKKKFGCAEEYLIWKEDWNKNPFLYWKYKEPISSQDVEYLHSRPLLLLQMLLLNNRWIFFDNGCTGMPWAHPPEANLLLGDLEANPDVPEVSAEFEVYPKEVQPVPAFKTSLLLKNILNRVDGDSLFHSITLEALRDYNLHYKTEELREYNHYVAFVLAVGKERLLEKGRKEQLWEICEYYRNNYHLSWSFNNYLISLLFEIDSNRTRPVVEKIFDTSKEPSDRVFARTAFLELMISEHFHEYEELVERWYWHIQDKYLNHHPNERDTILCTLQQTSDQTRKLYRKITSDPRFIKVEGDDRRQRTEVGGQRSEVGGRRSEGN
ncbi:MAG: hypothetical protein P8075_11845 [Deltaproteobacteria bacterium]|jgi:hypothetical protein